MGSTPVSFEELSGAGRSLAMLERVGYLKHLEQLSIRATTTINTLQWLPAHQLTIQRGLDLTVWHTGHVSAVLEFGANVIVGTQTGGVWLVNQRPTEVPIYNQHAAIPLSFNWPDPDIMSLADGLEGLDFYAGTRQGLLFYVELGADNEHLGSLEHRNTYPIPLPAGISQIFGIAVLPDPRRIILATASGVWWSNIPASLGTGSAYSWTAATGLPTAAFSGLAVGPNDSIIAAVFGRQGGAQGIFRGTWNGNVLSFMAATISGAVVQNLRRTSVAACKNNRNFMYAVAASPQDPAVTTHTTDYMEAILASQDGGATWNAVNLPMVAVGNQGNYNNCIVVSPSVPTTTLIGWRAESLYLSADSGASWSFAPANPPDPNTHADIHALDSANPVNGETGRLWVGSDGGLAVSKDGGESFSSEYSKRLRSIQFYGFDVSSRFPGLIAGSTQDNGNIYLYQDSDRIPTWKTLDSGDGEKTRFIDELGALLRVNNTGNRVRIAFWNSATETFTTGPGAEVPVDGSTVGLRPGVLESVIVPRWEENGQRLYALAAAPGDQQVFGLFADRDGANVHFKSLATCPSAISALASYDGTSIIAATDAALYEIDPINGQVTAMTMPMGWSSSWFPRIQVTGDRAFALADAGRLLRLNPGPGPRTWTQLSPPGFPTTFAVHPSPGSRRLFCASDAAVHLSDDDGITWAQVTQGLPSRPHCTDLKIATGVGGRSHVLYLATYGWGIWEALIDEDFDEGPGYIEIPPEVVDILVGVAGDGGGIVIQEGRPIKIPPYQPVMQILQSLVQIERAKGLSPGVRDTIRRESFAQIAELAQQQLKALNFD